MFIEQTSKGLKQPNVRLKKARLERGWSQQEVANLIDAPQTFMISRWEGGTSVPNIVYRERLCVLFGKSGFDLGFPETPPVLAPNVLNICCPIYDPAIPIQLSNRSALVGRDKLLRWLKRVSCDENGAHLLALNGLPGVGKTVLATDLVSDPEVRKYFDGGILWAGLGPRPCLLAHFHRWGTLFSLTEQDRLRITDEQEWTQTLRRLIGKRRMLIIIDDTWNFDEALKCIVGGEHCTYVVITRIAKIASSFAEKYAIKVPELDQADSLQLLKQLVPFFVETEKETAREIVQMAGGLPLTLNVVGKYLLVETRHHQSRRIQTALQYLLQIESRFQMEYPRTDFYQDTAHMKQLSASLQTTIDMSMAFLDDAARQALYALSVFPAKPNSFPEDAALAIAGRDVAVLDHLVDMGLLEVWGENRYQIHQTIVDYARLYLPGQKTLVEERMMSYWIHQAARQSLLDQDVEAFELEVKNILTALELACRRGVLDFLVQGIPAYYHTLKHEGFSLYLERFLLHARASVTGHGGLVKNYRSLFHALSGDGQGD